MNQLNALSDAGESRDSVCFDVFFPLHLAGVFLDFFLHLCVFLFVFFPNTEGPT